MSSIWAVANNTIKQALRMKIAVVFIILLLVLLPVLGMSITGDETLKGRLQTFISYGTSLTSLLLCILTITISIYTVTNDIKHRQIFTIVTKPIRRVEYLAGKLLGVVLLDVILLGIFAAIIYTITIYMPRFYDVTDEELLQVKNEFYTARASISMPEEDFTKQANERYLKLKESGEIPDDMTRAEALNEITNILQVKSRTADVGSILEWELENVKPLTDSIFLRFKYESLEDTPDTRIYSRWVIGDPDAVRTGEDSLTPIYVQDFRSLAETFYEIEISSEVIPASGKLAIVFYNYPSNNTVVMFPEDGMEVLFKAESFTLNFIKAAILILCRLIFLACLGILSSTFLSFPVALLLCLGLYVSASFTQFALMSFGFLSKNLAVVYAYTLVLLLKTLPDFYTYNPTKFLISARLVSWGFLGQCIFFMVCIKSFLLLILGFVIFTYREIAKIII